MADCKVWPSAWWLCSCNLFVVQLGIGQTYSFLLLSCFDLFEGFNLHVKYELLASSQGHQDFDPMPDVFAISASFSSTTCCVVFSTLGTRRLWHTCLDAWFPSSG